MVITELENGVQLAILGLGDGIPDEFMPSMRVYGIPITREHLEALANGQVLALYDGEFTYLIYNTARRR